MSILWQFLLGAGAVTALVLYIYYAGKAAAKAHAKAAAMAETLENIKSREKTDEKVESLPAAERRERLRVWVRDDK